MEPNNECEQSIWWIAQNGNNFGPLSERELRARVLEGDVSWQDQARRSDADEWKPIASLNIFSDVSFDAPRGTSTTSRRGKRNDDSLLFSPDKVICGEICSEPGVTSGLLDIRRLAATYAEQRAPSTVDSAPVFAGQAFCVSPSLLVPQRPAPRHSPIMIYALVGVASVLMMTSAALAAVALGRTAATPMVTGGLTGALAGAGAAPTDADHVSVVPLPSAVAPIGVPIAAPTAPLPSVVQPSVTNNIVAPVTRKQTSRAVTRKAVTPTVRSTRRKVTKTPKTPAVSPKWDEYACLLAVDPPPACNAYSGATSTTKAPAATAPDPALPERVSRVQISSAMRRLNSRVDRCADLISGAGLVKVKVKVSANGSVTGVTATSSPDPKLSSCIAGVVKKASFPKTQSGATFVWAFPLR